MANIPGTNVPAVTFGATGFQAPQPPAVLAGVQADWNGAFSGTLSYQLTTPQGQLASTESALIVNTNQIFVFYTNMVDPAFAFGRMQDAIGRIYNIERLPSEPTVLQIVCTGLQNVVIPLSATVVDGAGNIYQCTQAGTIPASGSITLPFAALVPGPTPVPVGVTIYQAIPNWDAATVGSGVVGQNTETRAQFEARRQQSVAKNSVGSLPSILGAVLAVPGVLDAYVTENTTSSPQTVGGFTIAAKSVYVAVTGGLATDVANAIWSKKAPGCGYNGNTAITVYDQNSGYSQPYPSYPVSFETPAALPILFAVQIPNSTLVPSDAVTQIQNAIMGAFAGTDGGQRARIGSNIYASRYAAPIAALGPWAQIISLGVGSNNTAAAVVVGSIVGTTLTVTAVTSGAVAVGQTIAGLGITVGTTITGLISGSGGTGTYLISQSQSVAGATFTGNGSGTNLTASAVTGVIGIGDVIAGTGIPTGTTIVSQTSGTPGGAGVYVTSGPTTASSAAVTAGVAISCAVANQNLVQVGIAQEPTIAAADIYVTLSS